MRARVILAFGVGGFLVLGLVAAATFWSTRSSVVSRRDDVSIEAALTNARVVDSALASTGADIPTLLSSLPTVSEAQALLRFEDEWFSVTQIRPDQIPQTLRDAALIDGRIQFIRHRSEDGPRITVGVPLPDADGAYFESSPADETDAAIGELGRTLAIAVAVGVALSSVVGWWASRRVLAPLTAFATAADRVAEGELDQQLDAASDRDLRQLAVSFNSMSKSVVERLEREQRFTSDVSHELRSPLMTLRTTTDLLIDRKDGLPDRTAQLLDLLAEEVDSFERLVLTLLEISRAEAGVVPQLESTDLVEFVRQAIDGSAPVHTSQDLLYVQVDRSRFRQVLTNIIENAAQYAGGVTSVEVSSLNGTARIAIEDSGPGIPADEASFIFERFRRGNIGKLARQSGSGLGLALVAEHVRSHNGRIWVEPRPDGTRGARFVIEIPTTPEP